MSSEIHTKYFLNSMHSTLEFDKNEEVSTISGTLLVNFNHPELYVSGISVDEVPEFKVKLRDTTVSGERFLCYNPFSRFNTARPAEQ